MKKAGGKALGSNYSSLHLNDRGGSVHPLTHGYEVCRSVLQACRHLRIYINEWHKSKYRIDFLPPLPPLQQQKNPCANTSSRFATAQRAQRARKVEDDLRRDHERRGRNTKKYAQKGARVKTGLLKLVFALGSCLLRLESRELEEEIDGRGGGGGGEGGGKDDGE